MSGDQIPSDERQDFRASNRHNSPVPCADPEETTERSDEEGDEGELANSQREPVHVNVDEGEGLEPGVKHRVHETL